MGKLAKEMRSVYVDREILSKANELGVNVSATTQKALEIVTKFIEDHKEDFATVTLGPTQELQKGFEDAKTVEGFLSNRRHKLKTLEV